MDPSRLKKWKTQQRDDAKNLVASVQPATPTDLKKLYPEFSFQGCYTTSLDPYTKVWELLPYFSKIIVGITPYLKDEKQFIDWYGVSPRELLQLWEQGRVLIRILFPSATSSTPRYLNVFFEEGFPSTALDRAFDEAVAGQEAFADAHLRYQHLLKGKAPTTSIDGFTDHVRRAFKTSQTAYCQLRVLGFTHEADRFEQLLPLDLDHALRWLELCRLFCIGPIHYSLGGIHCVSSATEGLNQPEPAESIVYPADLGRVLAQVAQLGPRTPRDREVSIADCLEYYPRHDEARHVLLELDKSLREGEDEQERWSVQAFERLTREARQRRDAMVWKLRLLASTALGGATAVFDPSVGLLAALGFEIAARKTKMDRRIEDVARTIERKQGREHLTLLLDLDADVRRHFGDLTE